MTTFDRRGALCAATAAGLAVLAGKAGASTVLPPVPTDLFDSYAHVIDADQVRHPPHPLGGETLRPGTFDHVIDAAAMARDMALCNVGQACLVHRAFVYGYDNEITISAASAMPSRFIAIPVVDPQASSSAAKIARWHKQGLIAAVRMMGVRHDATVDWIGSPDALRLWDQAADLGLPMNLELYVSNNRDGLAKLVRLLEKRPRNVTIVDNLAVPSAAEPDFGMTGPWLDAATVPHLFFKVATGNFTRVATAGHSYAAFLRRAADLFGTGRLMWGSDHGQTAGPYAEKIALGQAAASALTPDEAAQFFHKTGRGLLWRKA